MGFLADLGDPSGSTNRSCADPVRIIDRSRGPSRLFCCSKGAFDIFSSKTMTDLAPARKYAGSKKHCKRGSNRKKKKKKRKRKRKRKRNEKKIYSYKAFQIHGETN